MPGNEPPGDAWQQLAMTAMLFGDQVRSEISLALANGCPAEAAAHLHAALEGVERIIDAAAKVTPAS